LKKKTFKVTGTDESGNPVNTIVPAKDRAGVIRPMAKCGDLVDDVLVSTIEQLLLDYCEDDKAVRIRIKKDKYDYYHVAADMAKPMKMNPMTVAKYIVGSLERAGFSVAMDRPSHPWAFRLRLGDWEQQQ